jgi:hypothetical protein
MNWEKGGRRYYYIEKYIESTQIHYKPTCSCTQKFVLCGDQTLDLLRNRRVYGSLRQISHLSLVV